MHPKPFIDLDVAIPLIKWLSWISLFLGVLHLFVWVIGEFFPDAYRRVHSEGLRKILVGNGNRLMWGGGGLLMLFVGGLGLACLWLIKVLERLNGGF